MTDVEKILNQDVINQIEISLQNPKPGDRVLIKFKEDDIALFIAYINPASPSGEIYFKQV